MKNWKKAVAGILAAASLTALAVGATACGGDKDEEKPDGGIGEWQTGNAPEAIVTGYQYIDANNPDYPVAVNLYEDGTYYVRDFDLDDSGTYEWRTAEVDFELGTAKYEIRFSKDGSDPFVCPDTTGLDPDTQLKGAPDEIHHYIYEDADGDTSISWMWSARSVQYFQLVQQSEHIAKLVKLEAEYFDENYGKGEGTDINAVKIALYNDNSYTIGGINDGFGSGGTFTVTSREETKYEGTEYEYKALIATYALTDADDDAKYTLEVETAEGEFVTATLQVGSTTYTMVAEDPTGSKPINTLNATSGEHSARIELFEDGSWKLFINAWGAFESEYASGTSTTDTATWAITLTVVSDEADVLKEDTYTIEPNADWSGYEVTIAVTDSVSFGSDEPVEFVFTGPLQ